MLKVIGISIHLELKNFNISISIDFTHKIFLVLHKRNGSWLNYLGYYLPNCQI